MESQELYVAEAEPSDPQVEVKLVEAKPAEDLRGSLVAKRDQLTAAFSENGGVIQQIERELESRRAAQHQLFGSIKTINEILGPEPEEQSG